VSMKIQALSSASCWGEIKSGGMPRVYCPIGQDNDGLSLHQCTVAGCLQSYKTPGWLARHIKSSHGGVVIPQSLIIPPSALVADFRLSIGGMTSIINLAGWTSLVVRLENPGNRSAGQNESQ
jgi:hypothetical protein